MVVKKSKTGSIKTVYHPKDKPSRMNNASYGSAMQVLYQQYQKTDLGKVGVISTSLNDLYLNDKLKNHVESCMRYAVAQAMLNGIGGGQTENALCIRELSPFRDLLDGNGNNIDHNQWIQHNYYGWSWRSNKKKGKRSSTIGSVGIPLYTTDKESRNDQKVIVVYGIEFLNGYQRANMEEIQFWRKDVKLIDYITINRNQKHPIFKGVDEFKLNNVHGWWEEETKKKKKSNGYSIFPNTHNLVYHNNMIILNIPILYKKDDRMELRAVYNPMDIDSWVDEVKIKGIVCEAIGSSVME